MTEDEAASVLAALGNPTRLRVYRVLVRAGPEGLKVGDVQRLLDVPPSTLAHHLAALARVGLVAQDRCGREVFCRADYDVMSAALDYLTRECCQGVEMPP